MAQSLTALSVQKLKEAGRYTDGRTGVVLQVQVNRQGEARKSWLTRYSLNGRRREIGLGAYPQVSLSEARERASEVRRLASNGIDPIDQRAAEKREQAAQAASTRTFRECAEAYLAAHEPSWKNPKHRQQWRNTLQTYAFPVMGGTKVDEITIGDVMRVIEPIWTTKTETASRVRGRIESVLSYAIARGYREPPNPAVWRGQIEALLPTKRKVSPVKHHQALPFGELPAFLVGLRSRPAQSARALELVILTASRSAMVRGALWSEFDLANRIWTIPKDRMKGGEREHRVPLSDAVIELIETAGSDDRGGLVFPNQAGTGPLSDAVFRALFARMGQPELTAHGFRSTFRDWCGEMTDFPRELAEHALAHRVGNEVELSYRRGDALERRRAVMEAWSAYCGSALSQ